MSVSIAEDRRPEAVFGFGNLADEHTHVTRLRPLSSRPNPDSNQDSVRGEDDSSDVSRLLTRLASQEDERLLALHELLMDCNKDERSSSSHYVQGLVCAAKALLFACDVDTRSDGGPRLAPWQLKRSIQYIEQRTPCRVEVDELASLVGVSSGHFSRAFKASMGLSPYRWQLGIRIQQAQSLLLKMDLPVEDIADRMGFVDSAHFTRVFKKIVGVTPGLWRRSSLSSN